MDTDSRIEGPEGSSSSVGENVTIAGLYDFEGFPWGAELFDFTVRLINDHEDGWFDDVLQGVHLNYALDNAACDQVVAARAFMNLTNHISPLHGIIGGRCSGPTKDIAFLGSATDIPVLSPSASSPVLSNKDSYPLFSRVVAPDDKTGEVGALVSLLRSFGWERISIINTDNEYTNDLVVHLKGAWEGEHDGDDPFIGEIGYSGTVKVVQEKVDPISVRRVLGNVPVDEPRRNSKVIVLVGHHQHTFPILKIANDMNFQEDTIWIGMNAWSGRLPENIDLSWLPPVPGYIGIGPYRELEGAAYKDFLGRLQADQIENHRNVSKDLAHWAADKMVDSLVAMAMALSHVQPDQRTNGTEVVAALRNLKFQGLSGTVEFNEKGDWANPRFSVMTLPTNDLETGWIEIGTVVPGFADIAHDKVCFPQLGCGYGIPSEKPPIPLPMWAIICIAALSAVLVQLCVLAFLYWREKNKKFPLKEQVRLLEEELRGVDSRGEAVQQRRGKLYHQIASLLDQPTPTHWTDAQGLVPVKAKSPEFLGVLDRMRKTMNDDETCHITSLYRVQNEGIWSYYVFRKNQLANKYGVDITDADTLKEIDVWHGTSSLNPDVIYNDMQEGFMVNYAQQGMYGRGIYFSERAGYADCYSYRVGGVGSPDDSASAEGRSEREMFLVKLLVGQAATLDHHENESIATACRSLVAPPSAEGPDGLKYDTVSGTGDLEYKTKIHVVYENGRAYPEYLVRYRKEKIDPASRRRRREQADAQQLTGDTDYSTSSSTTISSNGSGGSAGNVVDISMSSAIFSSSTTTNVSEMTTAPIDVETGLSIPEEPAVWMFEADGGGWEPYNDIHQSQLEAAYQADPAAQLPIQNDPWTYMIDLLAGTQTNIDHPSNKQRRIKRVSLQC